MATCDNLTCAECLDDVYCGWCGTTESCMSFADSTSCAANAFSHDRCLVTCNGSPLELTTSSGTISFGVLNSDTYALAGDQNCAWFLSAPPDSLTFEAVAIGPNQTLSAYSINANNSYNHQIALTSDDNSDQPGFVAPTAYGGGNTLLVRFASGAVDTAAGSALGTGFTAVYAVESSPGVNTRLVATVVSVVAVALLIVVAVARYLTVMRRRRRKRAGRVGPPIHAHDIGSEDGSALGIPEDAVLVKFGIGQMAFGSRSNIAGAANGGALASRHPCAAPMSTVSEQATRGVCGICLADYNYLDDCCLLTCGHYFHTSCLEMWLRKNGGCPFCKKAGKNLSPSGETEKISAEGDGATARRTELAGGGNGHSDTETDDEAV